MSYTRIEKIQYFQGKNSDKQFNVQFQLALVLYRLGSYGGWYATIAKIAYRMSETCNSILLFV